MFSDLEPEDAARVEPVMPDPKDCDVDFAYDYIAEHAPQMNFLLDMAGVSATMGDIEMFGTALAAIFGFAFNLGMKYKETNVSE